MSEDERESYAGHVAATVTAIATTLYSAVTGVAAGAWSFLTGLLTLDPTFILSGDWFTFTRLFAGTVGPAFFPGIPWLAVVGAVGALFLTVWLYKRSRNTKSKT